MDQCFQIDVVFHMMVTKTLEFLKKVLTETSENKQLAELIVKILCREILK